MPDLVSDSDDESDEEDMPFAPPKAGKVLASMSKLGWWEVLLDNQAATSVVHPRLLTNVRNEKSYICGLSGTAELPYVGELRGFFECKGSTRIIASVLCQSDVEDMYDITYQQGVSYTVHMPGRDLVFMRRDKLYVADMREWADDYAFNIGMVTTAAGNESNYSSKEVARARIAHELVSNAGFTSEKEAMGLVNDGNITGVPVTSHDFKRAFDIYGKPTARTRQRSSQGAEG